MSGGGSRRIGPVLATFLVANNMIGSGFFLLPASLARSGAVTVFSWVLCTVLAIVVALAFVRLAQRHPLAESVDDYVRPALGRDAGFLASTLYWLSCWIGNNAIAVAAFGYLAVLLPVDGHAPIVQVLGQIALIWLMFALNLFGPRAIARVQSACVVFGLLPVAAVLIGGWGGFDATLYRAAWNPGPASDAATVFAALAPVFWAFLGLESAAMVAGIVRDPARNVPLATIAGVLFAALVYIVASVLVMGVVPADELAASNAPFALVAARLFGEGAMPIIAAAAAIKAAGTFGGWMLVAGETGSRAARLGYLPALFGRQLGNGAAAPGLFVLAVAMTAIACLTFAPTIAEQFTTIIEMAVLLIVMAYAAAGLSLIVGTREHPPGAGERALGVAALVACALLVLSTPMKTVAGAALIAVIAWLGFRASLRHRR